MKIEYKFNNYLTNSGKQSVSWYCSDCHCMCFFDINGYFYHTTLPKDNLKESIELFTNAINNKTVEKYFNKPATSKKLYNNLCNCDPQIISFDHLYGVKRAKDILARGLEILEIKNQ